MRWTSGIRNPQEVVSVGSDALFCRAMPTLIESRKVGPARLQSFFSVLAAVFSVATAVAAMFSAVAVSMLAEPSLFS